MKIIKLLIAFFSLTALASCIDVEENILINDDDSGAYTMTMDMGKLFELKNQLGGGKEESGKPKEKKDTLIYVKDLMRNNDSVTAEEKELYKDATVKLNLDEANAEMKMVLSCPFKSINQLPVIKKNFYTFLNKLNVFDNLSNKPKPEGGSDDNEEMPSQVLNPGADKHQEFTAMPGKIENNIVSPENYKTEMMTDSSMLMMQQMSAMMGDMNFKTTITSAKEIKNYVGNGAKLSDNKKTVTFITTFTEMMEHPEKLSYKVEY
ncbi:MAG: hypothetical protein IPP48_07785 [Chitinophagaceae bacterium]|nr:hypothetical protein [Chitinophagaceae bacterium]